MIRKPFLLLITLYKKVLSPALPPSCRFYPSCSSYAYGAIETHGVVRGGFLAAKRLLKCHPFHEGGFDPVPGPYSAPGQYPVLGQYPVPGEYLKKT